jgi:hypothetical protein
MYKHISVLKSKGLVEYTGGYLILSSNKNQRLRYGHGVARSPFKLFTVSKDLNHIKNFLKSVPMLSNLYAQQRKIKRFQRISVIKAKAQESKFLTGSEFKIFKKHKETEVKYSEVNLSIKGSAKKMLCSNPTAIKRRKVLQGLGVIKGISRTKVLAFGSSVELLKQARNVYPYAKRSILNNCIYLDTSTHYKLI